MGVMTFDLLKIDSSLSTEVIKICIGIFVISIIFRIVRPDRFEEFKFDEQLLNSFKFIGYGLLAGYIYFIIKTNNFEEIDILTFFTFLLACFEATHNLILTLGVWLSAFVRLCFQAIFKPTKY